MAEAPRNPFARGKLARGAERRSPLAPFRIPRRPTLPTIRAPQIFRRGPRALQQSLFRFDRGEFAFPNPPPEWFEGTTPEWAVYWALLRAGYTPDASGLPGTFDYQSSQLGGRQGYGGLVLDFLLLAEGLAINVQGEFFHYEAGAGKLAIDRAQAFELARRFGLRLVAIDATDALNGPEAFVRDALAGIDRSHGALGF